MNLKADLIRTEAKRQGMNITKLAFATGVSRNTISAMLNGKSCSEDTAVKLAEALGVPLEKLEERRRGV